MKPGEYCVCGNFLKEATIVMRVSPCRCAQPHVYVPRALSSTKLNRVVKTWDDFENDVIRQERENAFVVRDRDRRRRAAGVSS